jgi:hypothetical protein
MHLPKKAWGPAPRSNRMEPEDALHKPSSTQDFAGATSARTNNSSSLSISSIGRLMCFTAILNELVLRTRIRNYSAINRQRHPTWSLTCSTKSRRHDDLPVRPTGEIIDPICRRLDQGMFAHEGYSWRLYCCQRVTETPAFASLGEREIGFMARARRDRPEDQSQC